MPGAFKEEFIWVPWVKIFEVLGPVPDEAVAVLFNDETDSEHEGKPGLRSFARPESPFFAWQTLESLDAHTTHCAERCFAGSLTHLKCTDMTVTFTDDNGSARCVTNAIGRPTRLAAPLSSVATDESGAV